jgi:hypothetical protein
LPNACTPAPLARMMGHREGAMLQISDSTWSRMLPKIKDLCPRLSPQDLSECEQRIDLLTAKIQNRHWVSRTDAESTAFMILKDAEASA